MKAPTISRRTALAASLASGASVAALGFTATKPADAGNHPDQALLDLNAELERRWIEAWRLRGPAIAAIAAADTEADRRTGGFPDRVASDAEWRAWWEASKEIRESSGAEALNRQNNAAWQALDVVINQIFATPATTPAGWAVWARAVACVNHELWNEEKLEDVDWHQQVTRRLLEAMIAAGGLALPAELTEV
jgi:hypothetical protein